MYEQNMTTGCYVDNLPKVVAYFSQNMSQRNSLSILGAPQVCQSIKGQFTNVFANVTDKRKSIESNQFITFK